MRGVWCLAMFIVIRVPGPLFVKKKKEIVSYRHATRLGKGEVLHKRLQKSAPKVAVSSTQVEAIYQRRGMCVCERV